MKELYWITRLDGVHNFLSTISVFIIVALVISAVLAVVFNSLNISGRINGYIDDDDAVVVNKVGNMSLKCLFVSILLEVIISFSSIFIPTTKEAYMIYGVGGTIDYIKSDSTLVNLPKKVTYALDKWVDEKIETDNKPQEEKHIEKEE